MLPSIWPSLLAWHWHEHPKGLGTGLQKAVKQWLPSPGPAGTRSPSAPAGPPPRHFCTMAAIHSLPAAPTVQPPGLRADSLCPREGCVFDNEQMYSGHRATGSGTTASMRGHHEEYQVQRRAEPPTPRPGISSGEKHAGIGGQCHQGLEEPQCGHRWSEAESGVTSLGLCKSVLIPQDVCLPRRLGCLGGKLSLDPGAERLRNVSWGAPLPLPGRASRSR